MEPSSIPMNYPHSYMNAKPAPSPPTLASNDQWYSSGAVYNAPYGASSHTYSSHGMMQYQASFWPLLVLPSCSGDANFFW